MTNTGHQKRKFLSLLLTIAFLLIGQGASWVISSGEGKIKIYFYRSEININNFKSLKMEFDRYLSKFGPYEFQPFSSRDVFEKQVKGKENCLLLLSSWHYRQLCKKYALTPALTGVRNGMRYQRKLLVADEKSADIEAASPGLIASASSLQYTTSALKRMLKKFAEHTFQVLTVPKDIDALMSVGHGMAKLAFASENAFDELKGVNPRLCSKMKVLAEGEETLRLILALPQGFKANRKKMVDMIKNMSMDSDVSNELNPEMEITLFRYIFPRVKRIGVLYSEKYNKHWFNTAQATAKEMGVEIMGRSLSKRRDTVPALKDLLSEIDALWLISDPVVMSDKDTLKELFKECDVSRKPILSYHDAFAEYGAVLIVSVDNPTTGRQAAAISREVLSGDEVKRKVQLPAGSHIIMNLKKANEYGLKYGEMALSVVNRIIE